MITHIEGKNLNDAQHSFWNQRSTISQILHFHNSILMPLEEGQTVDTIYLDFSKTFDKVNHTILLKKVESMNITRKIRIWIKDFLNNCLQRVRIKSVLSNSKKVMSGVPQGSILGPSSLLIMIRYIDEDTLNAMVGVFADNTWIWRVFWGEEDVETLQGGLNKTCSWADLNNKIFNCDKFGVGRFKVSLQKEESDPAYLAYNGGPIPFKEHIKDLGVWMATNLTFDEHIRTITSKAKQMSSMVLCSFKSWKTSVLLPLLKSLVQSKVEYACLIWNPTDSTNINCLEDVQRQFLSKFQRFR